MDSNHCPSARIYAFATLNRRSAAELLFRLNILKNILLKLIMILTVSAYYQTKNPPMHKIVYL